MKRTPLFADDGDWTALPGRIVADRVLARIVDATRARAQSHLAAPGMEHVFDGINRLTSARQFLGCVLDLATVARLDNDAAAAERARTEILRAAALPDWGVGHFLDVAEYSLGMATGFSWLHDQFSAEEQDAIAEALIARALRPSFEASAFELRWLGGTSNWTQVCHAGLVAAALAIEDREPRWTEQVIPRAVADQAGPASAYAPDGAYAEGPIYWGYGTTFHIVLLSLLEKARGHDQGLADYPGFLASADYIHQMVSPGGMFFNYADSREQVPALPVLHWFASRRQEPWIAACEIRRLESGHWTNSAEMRKIYERLDALALWWRQPCSDTAAPAPHERPLRWVGRGENPVAVARTAWSNANAAFLGIKGGSAATSHAHRDAGSFVFETGGIRWAIDPGMQEYDSLLSKGIQLWDGSPDGQRWKIFRLGSEGHNVLRFVGGEASVEANAPLTATPAGFEVDLTPLHTPTVSRVTRTASLDASGSLTLEDRWTTETHPVSARWQWLTRAAVEPAEGGAILSQDGRQLELRVAASNPWTLQIEKVEDLLAPYDAACPGWIRLTIQVDSAERTTAHLCVTAMLRSVGSAV